MIKKIRIFFFVIIIILFSYSKNTFSNENTILFKINNKAFTTYDLKVRSNYLDFVGNNKEVDKKTIIKDYISANLFFEYYKKNNNINELNKQIKEIYNNINEQNKKNNKVLDNKITKENIYKNLKIDLARKAILEKLLNNKKDLIMKEKKDNDLIYEYKIKYLNTYIEYFDNLSEIKNFKNLNEVKEFLLNKKKKYFIKETIINNTDLISFELKEKILNNEDFFYVEDYNNITFILIEKNFKTFEGLTANIITFETSNDIDERNLNCEMINQYENVQAKQYDFDKLNDRVKKNLFQINDYIKFENNENGTSIYVLLCGINFDRNILRNISVNSAISTNINIIETNFINEYSKKYNLIKFYE